MYNLSALMPCPVASLGCPTTSPARQASCESSSLSGTLVSQPFRRQELPKMKRSNPRHISASAAPVMRRAHTEQNSGFRKPYRSSGTTSPLSTLGSTISLRFIGTPASLLSDSDVVACASFSRHCMPPPAHRPTGGNGGRILGCCWIGSVRDRT